ncbi:MAG: restriction endonuclease [Deltaproteobacteria bacterium]|nr:restriction endonuclease [Deltaproteobacteria bacterium]
MNTRHGMLSEHFDCFGYKRLSAVEVDPAKSNEHEFNGVSGLKQIFGLARREKIPCRVHYLCDDEECMLEDVLQLTWYDARENHPTRSEYRLYYTDNPCIGATVAEDVMILCRNRPSATCAEPFTMFLSKNGDTVTAQLLWLFGISERQLSIRFAPKDVKNTGVKNFYASLILDKLGIVSTSRDDELLSRLHMRFAHGFPSTRVFSAFARELSDVDPRMDPDGALSEWLSIEDRAFRVFEKNQLESKINTGFADVDEFIRFSLSVQNRRKSRAGYALENHLLALFTQLQIDYGYNVVTEHASRPDFIFPGLQMYQNESFPTERLTMLGAKTTCKDRWRQVLAEASRISQKHLCTLEPGISVAQTTEMRDSGVQLVVPKEILSSFTPAQQTWLITVADFIAIVKERQQAPRQSPLQF